MKRLSNNTKEELVNAMNDQSSVMFVADGKLISLEAHDSFSMEKETDNAAQEIEEYPELKESLQRFFDNTDMKSYTAKEFKELRNDRR